MEETATVTEREKGKQGRQVDKEYVEKASEGNDSPQTHFIL